MTVKVVQIIISFPKLGRSLTEKKKTATYWQIIVTALYFDQTLVFFLG